MSQVPVTTNPAERRWRLYLVLFSCFVFGIAQLPQNPYGSGLSFADAAVVALFVPLILSALFGDKYKKKGCSELGLVLTALSAGFAGYAAWIFTQGVPRLPAKKVEGLVVLLVFSSAAFAILAAVLELRRHNVTDSLIREQAVWQRLVWEMLFPLAMGLGVWLVLTNRPALAVAGV